MVTIGWGRHVQWLTKTKTRDMESCHCKQGKGRAPFGSNYRGSELFVVCLGILDSQWYRPATTTSPAKSNQPLLSLTTSSPFPTPFTARDAHLSRLNVPRDGRATHFVGGKKMMQEACAFAAASLAPHIHSLSRLGFRKPNYTLLLSSIYVLLTLQKKNEWSMLCLLFFFSFI